MDPLEGGTTDLVLQLAGVPFQTFGRHSFDVSVDDRFERGVPLSVRSARSRRRPPDDAGPQARVSGPWTPSSRRCSDGGLRRSARSQPSVSGGSGARSRSRPAPRLSPGRRPPPRVIRSPRAWPISGSTSSTWEVATMTTSAASLPSSISPMSRTSDRGIPRAKCPANAPSAAPAGTRHDRRREDDGERRAREEAGPAAHPGRDLDLADDARHAVLGPVDHRGVEDGRDPLQPVVPQGVVVLHGGVDATRSAPRTG